MANVVITTTAATVSVDFGDLASGARKKEGTWKRGAIQHVVLSDNEDHIDVFIPSETIWSVTYSSDGANFVVDSIDGAAPTSNADLYTKLKALII